MHQSWLRRPAQLECERRLADLTWRRGGRTRTLGAQLTLISRQRNELLCTAFLVGMRTMYTADQLVFMDETSKDDRALRRLYGYSYAGTRAPSRVPSVRGQRFSATAAIATTGLIAYDVVPGASNTTHLMRFAHTFLVRHVPMHVRARAAQPAHTATGLGCSRAAKVSCACARRSRP